MLHNVSEAHIRVHKSGAQKLAGNLGMLNLTREIPLLLDLLLHKNH